MGQEASLPEQQEEDFDEQAKAPPSIANPNDASVGRSSHLAGRRIGTMFQRGSLQHGHGGGSGVNTFDREAARVAAEGGEMPYMEGTHYPNGGTNQLYAMAASNGQQYPNHQLTPEQQYYQQKQIYEMQQQQHHQQQQQQQHQHQQMLQQQYYRQQQLHGVATSAPPIPSSTTTSPNSSEHPVVGVMYATDSHRSERGPNSGKKPAALRGKGAALISSMRNLSMAASNFRTSGTSTTTTPAAPGTTTRKPKEAKEVNDWETRWDEDDDDSDGEDDMGPGVAAMPPSVATVPMAAQSPLPLHQPLRPGMDGGHSSAQSSKPIALAQPVDLLSAPMSPPPPTMPQQHKAPPMSVPPVPVVVDLLSGVDTTSAAVPLPQSIPTTGLSIVSRGDQQRILVSTTTNDGDSGLQWDTGAPISPTGVNDIDKPNVKMFLPMLRVLGKGSFGKVVLVQKRVGRERGSLFAMKILRKAHLVKRRQIERTRTERKVLSAVNHPFIMKLHYAFQSDDKLYLVLDYCPGGELFFHLSRFRRFPERVARFYAAELLLAIGHLHKRGIIYRDLKPENVLLDAEGHVKLGDFGLAKAGIVSPVEGALSMCGTPEYMAPEVLNQQGHGFCVDYWGLGMLVYEMMTGLPPWYTTDRSKLFRRLKSAPLDIPSYFSPQSANCVSALLERNPRRRLGVTGIRTAMEHDFFRSINWRALYSRRVEAPIRPCEGWKPPEAINGDDSELVSVNNNSNAKTTGLETMASDELDAATSNFDSTFTRMPVETDDSSHDAQFSDDSELEELCADTFVGFTFDETERDTGGGGGIASSEPAARQRSHHYQQQQQQHSHHPHHPQQLE